MESISNNSKSQEGSIKVCPKCGRKGENSPANFCGFCGKELIFPSEFEGITGPSSYEKLKQGASKIAKYALFAYVGYMAGQGKGIYDSFKEFSREPNENPQ